MHDCLTGLRVAVRHAQKRGLVTAVKVVVVAHQCTDETADIARAVVGRHLDGDVVVLDDDAWVGHVRDLGVRVGLESLPPSTAPTWILSTDADTVVGRDWITQTLTEAAAAKADCVVGLVRLDAWRGSEAARRSYERILAAKMHPLDPQHSHDHVYGANLAIRSDAYLAVGGFPTTGHGEDQRLVDALSEAGYAVVRTSTVQVTTSGRLEGRAADGLATLIRRLDEQQSSTAPAQTRVLPDPGAERSRSRVAAVTE